MLRTTVFSTTELVIPCDARQRNQGTVDQGQATSSPPKGTPEPREPITSWKLMPSAVVSWIEQPETSRASKGPSSHMPHLVCVMSTPETIESESAPPMPLTCEESSRILTSPTMATSWI